MNAQGPEALVRAVANEPIPEESPELLAVRRERTVEALGRAIRQNGLENERRSSLRRRVAAFGAAAAIGLFGVGAYALIGSFSKESVEQHASVATVAHVKGTLVATHAGRARIVAAGEQLSLVAGDELRTATDGGAELRTERSKVTVAPATELRVLAPSSAEERIRLALGRVDLSVSKQTQTPRSVVVETPDAEVVVRGTVFSVAVADKAGTPHTRVHVTEGSVWVLSGGQREIVSTGEDWDSLAPRAEAAPVTPADEARPKAEVELPEPRPLVRRRGGQEKSAPRTTLAEQNRLFQSALDARNRGDERRSIEIFGALIARYPRGALAEEARVERLRALRRLGDKERASAEARRYLSEFPNGFGREEARDAALGEK